IAGLEGLQHGASIHDEAPDQTAREHASDYRREHDQEDEGSFHSLRMSLGRARGNMPSRRPPATSHGQGTHGTRSALGYAQKSRKPGSTDAYDLRRSTRPHRIQAR